MSFLAAADVAICHDAHGLPLPNDLPKAILDEIADYNAWMYAIRGNDVHYSRLAIGPLCKYLCWCNIPTLLEGYHGTCLKLALRFRVREHQNKRRWKQDLSHD